MLSAAHDSWPDDTLKTVLRVPETRSDYYRQAWRRLCVRAEAQWFLSSEVSSRRGAGKGKEAGDKHNGGNTYA